MSGHARDFSLTSAGSNDDAFASAQHACVLPLMSAGRDDPDQVWRAQGGRASDAYPLDGNSQDVKDNNPPT